MIYCVPIEQYPKKGMFIEELDYKDENDFEWKIARIENGFIVRYFGDEHLKENIFECELLNGERVRVKNTNCIFFQDVDFETFCEVRNTIKTGYTDDIWGTFRELFAERLNLDKRILNSEIVD